MPVAGARQPDRFLRASEVHRYPVDKEVVATMWQRLAAAVTVLVGSAACTGGAEAPTGVHDIDQPRLFFTDAERESLHLKARPATHTWHGDAADTGVPLPRHDPQQYE